MKTYIYTLSCPITKEVRYVGKTTNIKRRQYQHFNKKIAKSIANRHLGSWILNLLNDNKKPIFTIIEEVYENWSEREIYWITQYDNLCNLTKGGEGCRKSCSEETKIKISKAQIGISKDFSKEGLESLRKRFIHNNPLFNPEIKERWLISQKESRSFCKTEDFKNKQKVAHKQRLIDYSPPRSKKIINFITQEIYESIEAAAKSIGIKSYNLRRYLSGKIKNKTNFKYYEEDK